MASRQRRVERPIASATWAAQSPMAKSQEQQRVLIKRAELRDQDENNNRHGASPSIGSRQLHKSKRDHCSSLNLSGSGASQRQLATCVTQSGKATQVIAATSKLRQPTKTPASSEARKPLAQVNRSRWKSSTSGLNYSSATPRWQSATTGNVESHISEPVSSRGQWCCELPHHSSGAQLNTRRQANLAPLLNKVRQDLEGLRNKRAASSLSLVSAGARQSPGDISARPLSKATQRRAPTTANTTIPTDSDSSKSSRLKPQAISRLEQVPQASLQVTNSRLRQGALFARRQLHLLSSQALMASPPRLGGQNVAPHCARPQSVAPASNRAGASKVRGNSSSPATSKPSTACEARRRATRQIMVVAASTRTTSSEHQPLKLVKAEKKASHLTSSSSSLSLSTFKVKRPRQQQQSSTSSSCSSISTASRRWSSSSGADSPSLSQSCSQLATNLDEWSQTCSEHPPTCQLIGSNKTTSENLGPPGERVNARQTPADEPERRTRFVQATNEQQSNPKQANRHPEDFGPTKQDIDHPNNLLDSALNQLTNPIEPSDISQCPTTGSESGSGARHAFLVQSDEEKPAEQQVKLHATRESIQLEDADIVAIGCSPLASIIAAPSTLSLTVSTKDNLINSKETTQRLALDDTMATNATSCNTNEYQLIVTSNNHNAENDPSKSQGCVLEKNVDMQISLDVGGDDCRVSVIENINNNIDVREQTDVAGMDKGLISPLDLSTRSFVRKDVPQDLKRTSSVGLKNQPLGLHQSMNIAAGLEQLPQASMSVCREGNAINDHFFAIDLTLVQADQTTRSVGDERDLSHSVQKSPLGESLSGQNVIAKQQKIADIPIRLEPISDFYDLELRPFARGKFAQVKRCTRKSPTPHMTMGECYAAKCIKKRRRLVDIKHEILLEIEALKLCHETEHIVRLYEVYETQNEMFLVLEMAKGGELQRVLDDEEQIEEPLVRRMIDQILEGLIHLHDNEIAHLDIKPQNLLLSKPFPHGNIKLCDFGISRRITKDCEIREICGTPDYVAPEILRYDPISLATDMWSLGVLTYVLLSGYSPFGSENKQKTFCNITQATLDFPQEIFSRISNEAVDFIRKLIVREPAERLTSRQAKQHHWISNHRSD